MDDASALADAAIVKTGGRDANPMIGLLERQRLAMTGDESAVAVGKRLRAVRLAFGVSPDHLGRSCFADAQHILDAEAGIVMPKGSIVLYYWQNWRIPDEFILEGRKIDLLPVAAFEQRIFAQLSRP